MKLNQIAFIIFIFSLPTCWASKLIIKSQPEGAEIFINSNGRPVRLGATPYEANLNEVIDTYVKSSSFALELKKPGHNPYRILLAKTADIDMELTANLELNVAVSNIKEHDLLMNELFDVQKMVRGRNFRDALIKLDELEKKHPNFSIIPELKATTYYMNKDVENALSYYRKAFSLNPENSDAYRMKIYLEKKLGVDSEVK
ncbi:MAG: tetratricopeptide repeat protein [Bacteriovoracaceae bacterium]